MKKVLLITSLCAVGRAGLYPQILEFAGAGVQACPLPSAVLSTHTGGLGTPAKALTGDAVLGALRHYAELGIKFDALVTGYLPEAKVADGVIEFLENRGAGMYVCDPVMADGGKFYGGMGEEQAAALRKLIPYARVITPNATEAAILLGLDPAEHHTGAELAWGLIHGGAHGVVVTGGGEEAVTYGDERGVGEHYPVRVPGRYIGTGDLFCVKLTLGLLAGRTVAEAAVEAADGVSGAIQSLGKDCEDWRYGMPLEGAGSDR